MPIGLIGTKVGMTRVFTKAGAARPVTVVHVPPNRVMQNKTTDRDGYDALQMTSGARRRSSINKPLAGHARKAGVFPGGSIREFRVEKTESRPLGSELDVRLFAVGQKVSVSAKTKGKGFAGTVKRHHFSMQDASHGNSLSHRTGGSIGQCQLPGRVFKGKKMAGQMGSKRRTIKNLEIVRVDEERQLLLIEGAVPGCTGCEVVVTSMQAVPYQETEADGQGTEQRAGGPPAETEQAAEQSAPGEAIAMQAGGEPQARKEGSEPAAGRQ